MESKIDYPFLAIKQRIIFAKLLTFNDVTNNWFRIGRKLGVGRERLDIIGDECDDVTKSLERVLDEWWKGKNASLDELYGVLKSLKHDEAASKLLYTARISF